MQRKSAGEPPFATNKLKNLQPKLFAVPIRADHCLDLQAVSRDLPK